MRKIAWWALGALGLLLAAAAAALSVAAVAGDVGHRGRVTVTGSGFVDVQRDLVITDIGVSVLRDTATDAFSDAEGIYQDVRSALLGIGVKSDELTTSGVALYPEYDYWSVSDRKPALLGYRAQLSLHVKTRAKVAAKIFDAAVTAGGDAVTLSGISFDVEGKESANNQARRRAIQQAKSKAKLYAEELGLSLGKALKIVEVSSSSPIPIYPDYNKGEGELPIDPGKARTSTLVEVTFELHSARILGGLLR